MKLFAESPTVLCTCKCIKQHLQRFSVTRENSFMHVPGLYSFIFCRNRAQYSSKMISGGGVRVHTMQKRSKKMAIIRGVRSCCSLEVVKFVATIFWTDLVNYVHSVPNCPKTPREASQNVSAFEPHGTCFS